MTRREREEWASATTGSTDFRALRRQGATEVAVTGRFGRQGAPKSPRRKGSHQIPLQSSTLPDGGGRSWDQSLLGRRGIGVPALATDPSWGASGAGSHRSSLAFRALGRQGAADAYSREKGRQGHPKYPRFVRRRRRVLGRPSLLGELILRRSVLELPKGAGDGMTTHQVLPEGGDGPW